MIGLVKTGKTVKISRLPQIGMKDLNTPIAAIMVGMAAVLKVIKVNFLNLFLAEVNIVRAVVAVILAKE